MKKALALLLLGSLTGCGEDQPSPNARLLDENGRVLVELNVTIAASEYERQEGLRLHGPLAENEALLLVFPKPTQVCITNSGVPFPIDVLYLSKTNQILTTELNIAPNAPGPYCHPQTQSALELNGDRIRGANYSKLELF